MAEVKWIKVCTDIFDDDKILLIESMPKADSFLVIWFKLLCMAGKQNNDGVFMLNEKKPYTDKMLATIFHRPVNIVKSALEVFEQFGMIEIVNGTYTIPNWEKHQNTEKLEKDKELNRKRVAAHREKQKRLAAHNDADVMECNSNCNDNVMDCNALHNADVMEQKRIEENRKEILTYQLIVDMFNEICVSFPRVTVISERRKAAMKARMKQYSKDQFKKMFEIAESTDFLKGKNSKDWSANFDWLMKDSNFAKVLDGNYGDRSVQKKGSGKSYDMDEVKEMFNDQ